MHPLVEKFVRGVFNRGPAFSQNIVTWDADIELTFLKKWSPVASLSLPQLTLKVVLLCLLVSGQRGQSLWLLDLRNITWSKTDIRCTFGDLLKTSAPNRHQDELVFGSFPEDKSLCVVHYCFTMRKVCLFVGCLTSQQQASVSQGRICSDNFTCCHTEIEVADPTFYLTQSQYTDTGLTSPSADPITPGAWQGSHWSANF